jgi:hypothetical protein
MKRLMTLMLVTLLSLGVASVSIAQEGTQGGQAGSEAPAKAQKKAGKKHAKKRSKKSKKKHEGSAGEEMK